MCPRGSWFASIFGGSKSILLDTDDAALSKYDGGHDEYGEVLYESTVYNVKDER
jgi:hypothetical protein